MCKSSFHRLERVLEHSEAEIDEANWFNGQLPRVRSSAVGCCHERHIGLLGNNIFESRD